jgi:hypothetical protein
MALREIIEQWRSELVWGTLAVLGCLGMLIFEAVFFRLAFGKW